MNVLYLSRDYIFTMIQNPDLNILLKEFTEKKILIVGDVMVDEYLWGSVARISPEAPVPVVACNKREHRMGGAANVAVNIKAMGAEPVMCSVIGKDEVGSIYKSLLKENQMTDIGIMESVTRTTTVKTRVIGDHQHLLRVDHEMTRFLDDDIAGKFIGKIQQLLDSQVIDAIIFQDYDKGVITGEVIDEVTRMAGSRGIMTLVDPKKRSFGNYRHVTLFKPNFKELTEGLNIDIKKGDYKELHRAVKVLHTHNHIANVMVTLSELGVFISTGETYTVIPAEIRDVADVSGAGDTVVAVAALGLATGLSPVQCAALSNLAGGIVCEKVGVVPITPQLLLKEEFVFPEE